MAASMCRCGAMVEWVTMASGKRMPCEIRGEVEIPVDGAVVVCGPDNRNGVVVRGRLLVRVSHWATCPLRDQLKRDTSPLPRRRP
jgi:hypothetical protein